jgi:uncharacterized protein YerC
MYMRIKEINIYRDGGSIEFTLIDNENSFHVWLETPFSGEPRDLIINKIKTSAKSNLVKVIFDKIVSWENCLSQNQRQKIAEVLNRTKPYFNANSETSKAIELSRVIYVKNYIQEFYL